MYRILVIDDDIGFHRMFARAFGKGHKLLFARNGEEARVLLREEPVDLVISDLGLPDASGIVLLQESRELDQTVPFIVITAYGTVESAVEAMKLGAMDYITKPFKHEEMAVIIEKALRFRDRELERARLRSWASDEYSFGNLVATSRKMRDVIDLASRIADTPTTILIQGESGTGKELLARAIHQNSERRSKQFLGINCGALPESLLESELFGHLKGAFTGATRTKKGLFEEAGGGTILLDEISLISPAVQAKLLRVLQEREVRPVGGNQSIPVDTRVIAATNDDLRHMVEEGTFREDLFFRLSVVPITIPPLRDRKEEIPTLFAYFSKRLSQRLGKPEKPLSAAAAARLQAHDWPGNVRELENLVERSLLISLGDEIRVEDLPEELRSTGSDAAETIETVKDSAASLRDHAMRRRLELERDTVQQAIAEANGNKTKAAQLLGISRGSLYNRLRELREAGLEV